MSKTILYPIANTWLNGWQGQNIPQKHESQKKSLPTAAREAPSCESGWAGISLRGITGLPVKKLNWLPGECIGKDKTVAFHHLTPLNSDRLPEHGTLVGKGVKLAIFAAGIDASGQIGQQFGVKQPPCK